MARMLSSATWLLLWLLLLAVQSIIIGMGLYLRWDWIALEFAGVLIGGSIYVLIMTATHLKRLRLGCNSSESRR